MKNVEFKVEEGGKVNMDMNGFSGETCAIELQKILSCLQNEYGINISNKVVKRKASNTATARHSIKN